MRRPDAIPWESLLALPADDGLPLQTRLRQLLVGAVQDGRLDAGCALPSSRTLARCLGIARNTVVAVYGQLVADGVLQAQQRRGIFVGTALPSPPPASVEPGPSGPDWATRLKRRLQPGPALAKPSGWQDAPYPFVYGRHDPELFPTDEFRECFTRTLSRSRQPRWTPDLDVDDVPELVDQIRHRLLPRRGIFARADEVLVTVGSQQAFHLMAEALFDASTRLGLEDPGHPHARATFGLRSPTLVPLAVDAQGLVIDGMPPLDAVFVTPASQSPTTVTMTPARRQALLDHARAHDLLVIEDDYESGHEPGAARADEQQGATAPPALKSLDRDGRVLYVGSLPKTLSPAMRMAYLVGPAPVLSALRRLRHAMVRHPSALLQQVYALFLSLGHHETHERRVRAAMRERLDALDAALRRHLPQLRFERPAGGASVWLQGPPGLDTEALAAAARARGVLIEPGSVFFIHPPRPCPYLRLRLSSIRLDRIDAGVRALAQALADITPLPNRGATPPDAHPRHP
jgi:GntR family transcriptional regulator/MocR family aminotransferase